ncbi:MAG TPA: DUF4157 domain-containing protein [Burkholderiaceae bacterium]|nr:DUF4157 domain-containing protein [Burkholderiaceae bacterium]
MPILHLARNGRRHTPARLAGHVLQPRLRLSQPGDALEQEADRIAAQVLRMSGPGAAGPGFDPAPNHPVSIQRRCKACEEEQLQRKADATQPEGAGSSGLDSVATTLRQGGRALDPATRAFFEPRFGADFSHVRIHTDSQAAASARAVNALAYTVGSDLVFDAGQYAPHRDSGRRLLAHELTHVLQQGGAVRRRPAASSAPGARVDHDTAGHGSEPGWAPSTPIRGLAGIIQREVNPKRIANKDDVLDKVKAIADGAGKGRAPAEANLIRLGRLGVGFNPGATKEEKDNAFVYTCQCGWIDMGHFFISAAAAYGVGYQRRRLETRLDGKAVTIEQLLARGMDKLAPGLEVLLRTVPDDQGRNALSDVRKLLQSAEPRDIALVFGYWMEFAQQVAKVLADPGRGLAEPLRKQLKGWLEDYARVFKAVVPEGVQGTLEGSARSAFTMEDLPSDRYGAALGQDVWQQTDGATVDASPIHGLMKTFLSDCGAVFPPQGSRTRCEMMAETTPGSCRMEGEEPRWAEDLGEPARYGSTQPRLLDSARPLCGDAGRRPYRLAPGTAGAPLPAAVLDVSARDKSATLVLPEDIRIHQPREQGVFGGAASIPGRPERIDPKPPWSLRGPSFLRLTARGDVIAYSTFGGVQGLGDVESLAHLNLASGRFGIQARGPLEVHAQGQVHIDFERLLDGLAGPELALVKEVLKSDAFADLVKKLLHGDLGHAAFVSEAKALLKQKLPQGLKAVLDTLLERLQDREALALATRLDAQGTVRVGGVPISGFLLHKSVGMNPLLGLEGGLITSELAEGRVIVGAKGWLYGEKLLQAQLTAGVDPVGRKAVAELHAVNQTLTGNQLSLDLRYQVDPAGEQQFLVLFGGQHNILGSKGSSQQ